jgi:hypothetical protein
MLKRRELLRWAAAAGLLGACSDGVGLKPTLMLPDEPGTQPPSSPPLYADSVDALFDVLLPAEAGSPGAREAGVDRVLEVEHFARLAVAQGLLPPLDEGVLSALDDLSGTARGALNATLDARAQLERPLARFSELDRTTQEKIVAHGFEDDAQRPVLLVMRAACFVAWLGAVVNDAGLRDVGFPPFENFDDGLASSGFSDYSVNQPPAATAGDDLSSLLTAGGDLA